MKTLNEIKVQYSNVAIESQKSNTTMALCRRDGNLLNRAPKVIAYLLVCCSLLSGGMSYQGPSSLFSRPRSQSSAWSSSLAYSSTADPPLDHNGAASRSFAQRMRETVLQQQQQQPKGTVPRSHIKQVTTLPEFRAVVCDCNQIVAVQWTAPWCRACQTVAPAFARLGAKYQNVRYVAVPSDKADGNLHVGFGIASVPYGHIYHPTAGLVEELRLKPQSFAAFERILHSYVLGSCALPTEPDAASGIYAAPYERSS